MEMHLPKNLSPAKMSEYLPHKVKQSFDGKNVGTAERFVSGALGFWLLGSAMKRGVLGRMIMIPAGLAALKRAATGKCEIYQAAGLSSAEEQGSVSNKAIDSLKKDFSQKSLDNGSDQQLFV